MLKDDQLSILVKERGAILRFGNKEMRMDLCKKPLLDGIDKIVSDLSKIKNIKVKMKQATFSVTRQVVATVNTLAWQLGVKVNGEKQIKAVYDKEPNITV